MDNVEHIHRHRTPDTSLVRDTIYMDLIKGKKYMIDEVRNVISSLPLSAYEQEMEGEDHGEFIVMNCNVSVSISVQWDEREVY